MRAARTDALRLHTPAHRGHVDAAYGRAMGAALALDLTELEETDDLRDPAGAIAEAQLLAAAHFGAARTWFLVGGASAGNLAALLVGAAGRKVVVARNAHVSVVNGLVLAGAEPVWVPVPWDADWDVAGCAAPGEIAAALEAQPEAAAVLLTAPSYFGDAADIAAIRRICGDRLLIVDEAHGAHIPRALRGGADLVVHSAHKGLSGPTQGGYLHLGDPARLAPARISAALRLVQSTSPSYWLLAGLDAARRAAATAHLPDVGFLHGELREAGFVLRGGADPRRILVRVPDGPDAYDALATRGVVCEAALPRAVMVLLGPDGLDAPERAKLLAALASLGPGGEVAKGPPPPLPGAAVMSPRAAAMAQSERLAAPAAIGRICAEAVCPYPPGIPVLVPGERIGAEHLAFLQRHSPALETLAVVSGD